MLSTRSVAVSLKWIELIGGFFGRRLLFERLVGIALRMGFLIVCFFFPLAGVCMLRVLLYVSVCMCVCMATLGPAVTHRRSSFHGKVQFERGGGLWVKGLAVPSAAVWECSRARLNVCYSDVHPCCCTRGTHTFSSVRSVPAIRSLLLTPSASQSPGVTTEATRFNKDKRKLKPRQSRFRAHPWQPHKAVPPLLTEIDSTSDRRSPVIHTSVTS